MATETGAGEPPWPSIIIIGAMKCGTSSLWRYLDAHPDVTMSDPKETNFFASDNHLGRGTDWYRQCFERDGQMRSSITGEASPNYSKAHLFPGVPERIAAHAPNAKLVYLVRDPIERLYSHYMHNVAAGRERRPIGEVLEPTSGYVQTSMYARQLAPFRAHFPDESIKVIDADDLESDTARVVEDVLAFVGIDSPCLSESTFAERHHRSSAKQRPSRVEEWVRTNNIVQARLIPRRLRHEDSRRLLLRLLGMVVPRSWVEREPLPRPSLSASERGMLVELFRDDVAALEAILGRRFSTWKL